MSASRPVACQAPACGREVNPWRLHLVLQDRRQHGLCPPCWERWLDGDLVLGKRRKKAS